MQLRNLMPAQFDRLRGVNLEQAKQAAFAEDEQLAVGDRRCRQPAAEFNLPGLFDRSGNRMFGGTAACRVVAVAASPPRATSDVSVGWPGSGCRPYDANGER